ncbi:hypothetical protein NHQ30_004022 [Ciborinia camelliae]|nr:hypothetical protein NHQ30_004022 [Ciborinia camelliae]
MLVHPLSLAARRVRPQFLPTHLSQLRYYSQPPKLQKALVTISFDDETNETLVKVQEALVPWLRLPSNEARLFNIALDHNSPEIQAQRIQTIASKLQKFEIGRVNSRLECPNFLLRIARREDWNVYYENLYEEFRKSRLVPSNHLPRGPDIDFLCNIKEIDAEEVHARLGQYFPNDLEIHLGAVTKLNVYKDQDGKRQKSSFDIGATNSVLSGADAFAWGLPIPIPIPIGAIGGIGAGSAMQSPPGTDGSDGSVGWGDGGEGAAGGGGDGGGWLDGIIDGIMDNL